MSRSGGGLISRFGRPSAVRLSRRIGGITPEGRRAGAGFGFGGAAITGGGGGGGTGFGGGAYHELNFPQLDILVQEANS